MSLTTRLSFILGLMLIFHLLPQSFGQKNFQIATAGFYNLENLFDTLDTPGVSDTEFSPSGNLLWNSERYHEKLTRLAEVIGQLGKNKNPEGISLLGVAEVENRYVLEDLVNMPAIRDKGLRIVHFDSPDRRGIDVALLYEPDRFSPLDAYPLEIPIFDGTEQIFTREALYVKGLLDGDVIHILVNHWPSRRGGESKTAPWRAAGARVCRSIVDSLNQAEGTPRIIIMGDLNDDPVSPSVKQVLGARENSKEVEHGGLYNPMAHYDRRGLGSNAYRDTWSLFDQIIISKALLDGEAGSYGFLQAYVFNKKFLRQKKGHFKGYPFRTYGGSEYLGGYSDHFPVYIHLIKQN